MTEREHASETVAAVGGEAMVREAEWGAIHAHHMFVVCERPA